MSDFTIRKGDTLPILQATLTTASGTAVDLTNATSVSLNMRLAGTTTWLTNAATIVAPATNGVVQAQLTSANTATAGLYLAKWVVTFAGGNTETFPRRYFAIEVATL
ncbi:MAG: hypothetical protein HXX08_11375 [Chloroflexi bacterium]|uniref:Uncharacterized protein n=1 Tax=Candidatus Chlorohelix allophototropha TaxID=3003348 RepID=A0A8T7M2H2_9CHLR|nr:hypothetical protein [Chloroflexota bacterium]WJW65838.1 hypothetical protein OZ401_001617 [Chloroflexota bacterium L227-S17]